MTNRNKGNAKTMRIVMLMIGLLACASGCSARMAVIAHEKQAYIVRDSALGFNSDMYFCDASAGKPVCRKVADSE